MRRRILLVEDDLGVAKMVTKRLEVAGCDVDVAMEGPTALAQVHARRPELIILDVRLPQLDGVEVCYRLKHDPRTKDVPIVMFTAKALQKDYEQGMAAGADAYLTKPFTTEALEHVVNRLISALQPEPAEAA